MAPRKGLGRGLDSIIPRYDNSESAQRGKTKKDVSSSGSDKKTLSKTGSDNSEKKEKAVSSEEETTVAAANGVRMLKISEVEPNRDQPRKDFNEDSLHELADSIRQYGMIQPIIVQKRENYYEIIAGERRWRAARLAGLKEIPVLIREMTDKEILEVSLIENIQREDLNAVEEAQAYQRLLEEFSLTQDELAERVSKSRSTITNAIRLLKLDRDVLDMLAEDKISAGHARALLTIDNPALQRQTALKIFDEKLSVRDTERLVKSLTVSKPPRKGKQELSEAMKLIYQDMEERLKSALGTKVVVHYTGKDKGKLEIEYYSNEELERIFQLLRSCGDK